MADTNNEEYKELTSILSRANQLSSNILQRVDSKIVELKGKEEKWKQEENKMEENSNKVKNKVILDVGGQKFATSKDTLLSQNDSYFSALLRSNNFKPDDDGSFFIDRSPTYFAMILDYLRSGRLSVKHLNSDQIKTLQAELDYYQISVEHLLVKSEIVNGDQIKLIEQWSGKTFGKLLWRGSKHGFEASQFNVRCNKKGPTVTIVQSSNGWIFGGYADVPWTFSNNYFGSGNCFIFTLTNPHNIPPTKYIFNSGNYLYGHTSYGPTFGGGHDLHISDLSNTNNNSYTSFSSYNDTTGKGTNTFTGAQNFTTREVEVYLLK